MGKAHATISRITIIACVGTLITIFTAFKNGIGSAVIAKTNIDSLLEAQKEDNEKREKQEEINKEVYGYMKSLDTNIDNIKDILQDKYKR